MVSLDQFRLGYARNPAQAESLQKKKKREKKKSPALGGAHHIGKPP
jgi:hypothetical protein